MKTINRTIVSLLVVLATATGLKADPLIDSWFTTNSGRYARIYTSDANMAAGNAVTTWSNGNQSQSAPAYAGVQEIYSSSDWVYIRTTGLGSHVMGPWYLNAARTQIFPNFPVNTKTLYRFPRTPTVPATKTLTGLGAIGYFVDGISMFDSRDGFVWTGSAESGMGTGYWNRDAYVNEGVTLDPGLAHQEQTGTHHYHANPIALRYQLGDHVDYNSSTKTYSESTNPVVNHSPILGWVRDGHPVYGPYGYSDATNAASGVRRMISGYVLRNGQSGTDNLTATGRNTIPAWAARLYSVSTNQTGPTVSTTYPLGRYMEDNAYLDDLGYTQGVDFDLDEYNGRWCVTPEFPDGVYAYFVSISSNGVPKFPYNIGRAFHGNPTGSEQTSVGEAVSTDYLGGPNLAPMLNPPMVESGIVTLTWSATEGGTYRVESSAGSSSWSTNATNITATFNTASYSNTSPVNVNFYRVAQTALATYDPASGAGGGGGGNEGISTVSPNSGTHSTIVMLTITLNSGYTMPPPPNNVQPTGVTLTGPGETTYMATSYSRNTTTGVVTATVPLGATTGAFTVNCTFGPNTWSLSDGFTVN